MNRKDELIALARRCSEILKNKYHVQRVFLIGSLVKGHFHDRSDIDIVVEGLAPQLYIKALTELYDLLPRGIELNLIPFEDAFSSLTQKTVREGRPLHG